MLLSEGKNTCRTGQEQINCLFIGAMLVYLQSLCRRCLASARVRAKKNKPFSATLGDLRSQSRPTRIVFYLPTYLSTYLPTYLPACLPAYLPTYLPTYSLTHSLTHSLNQSINQSFIHSLGGEKFYQVMLFISCRDFIHTAVCDTYAT